jgi:EmrB/QacA subfamily drug resistance transporter
MALHEPRSHADTSTTTKSIALALLCGAQFVVILDAVIVNVALPEMQQALNLTPVGLQWVINAYVLVYGGCLLLGGRAADLFGSRRVFVAGLLLFTAASLAGGLAPSGTALIVARAVQGLGGAMISPACLSLISKLFQEGPERNRAVGAQGAVAGTGAACGVLLGGLLTGLFGWQSVLLVNVPFGLALAVMSYRYLPTDAAAVSWRGFDFPGAFTVTLGLAALVYAVVGLPEHHLWSAHTLTSLSVSIAAFASFVVIEQRARHPLVRFGIFSNRQMLGADLVAFVHPSGPLTTLFFLSLFMQQTLEYTPLQAGFAFLPFAVSAALGAIGSSQLARFVSLRRLIISGLATMACGLLILSRLPVPASYLIDLMPGLVLVGAGITLAGVPMFIAAVSQVKPNEAGLAAGLVNTCQQIGSAVVLAILVAAASTGLGGTNPVAGWRIAFQLSAALLGVGIVLAWLVFPSRSSATTSSATKE